MFSKIELFPHSSAVSLCSKLSAHPINAIDLILINLTSNLEELSRFKVNNSFGYFRRFFIQLQMWDIIVNLRNS